MPREPPATRRPRTSAILAGWICVGAGLSTAWIFPPAHCFFSIGIILSIVAMATHQVRDGLLLLAGSMVGIGVSALLFVFGLAALLFHAAGKLPEVGPPPAANLAARRLPASPSVVRGPTAVAGNLGPVPTLRPVPLTLGEVSAMISAGRGDDEIIAAASNRAPLGRLGVAEATTLRAYGAGDRLIEFLRTRFAPGDPPPDYRPTSPVAPLAAARTPAPSQTVRATALATVLPTPVDHAARDRQVADLKTRMEALDETVRRVRADPHWYGSVKGSTDTSRQQASDAYLADLDRQRNDLRRQKWALEGR